MRRYSLNTVLFLYPLFWFLLRKYFHISVKDVVSKGLATIAVLQMNPIGISGDLVFGFSGAAGPRNGVSAILCYYKRKGR